MDALLMSINDRLGGQEGQDLAPWSGDWIEEEILLNIEELEAQTEALQRATRQTGDD